MEVVEEPISDGDQSKLNQKQRFDCLLKQAEFFAHFVKGTSTSSSADNENAPSTSKLVKKATKQHFSFDKSPSYIVNGSMRDYQIRGLNWMISLYENGISGILADEMGLGKTIQTIAMLGYLHHYKKISGPHLVIVPKTTLHNWMKEFEMWCPSLRVICFWGLGEERKELVKNVLIPGKWDVCVTSYELVTLEKTALRRIPWKYMVIDEAHRIKNVKAQLSKEVRRFKTMNRLLLTGTPLQNSLQELWSLLNFLLPDIFASSDDFENWFNFEKLANDESIAQRLHGVLKPFMLRRIKADVEKSLLPKKEVKIFVGMSKTQRELYTKILVKNILVLNGQGEERNMSLLHIVMHLRKCTNHPYLFDGVEEGPPYEQGGPHLLTTSGKMAILDKLLMKLKGQGSRVLVFSQMTRMMDILEDYIIWRDFDYCRLDGDTVHEERNRLMEEFNAPNSSKFIFLLSTRAGGLGINLATADTVIIYDSDWNPQMDIQAMDRAHRIGQMKQVRVFRLVTEHTVDQRIIECAEKKLHLDRLVIQQGRLGDDTRAAPSKKQLLNMIRCDADYIFSSTEADMVDANIETILSQGETKTAAMADKFKNLGESTLRTFTLDTEKSSVYNFEGEDWRDKQNQNGHFDWIELPKRVPNRVRYYDVNDWNRPDFDVYDFQFVSPELKALAEKCFKRRSLPKSDIERMQALFAREPFSSWTPSCFNEFFKAQILHGDDLKAISRSVRGKTPAAVLAYYKVFQQRKHEIRHIRSSLTRKDAKKLSQQVLTEKLLECESPLIDLAIPIGPEGGFTSMHDRFLVVGMQRIGCESRPFFSTIGIEFRDKFPTHNYSYEMIRQRCQQLLLAFNQAHMENSMEQNSLLGRTNPVVKLEPPSSPITLTNTSLVKQESPEVERFIEENSGENGLPRNLNPIVILKRLTLPTVLPKTSIVVKSSQNAKYRAIVPDQENKNANKRKGEQDASSEPLAKKKPTSDRLGLREAN